LVAPMDSIVLHLLQVGLVSSPLQPLAQQTSIAHRHPLSRAGMELELVVLVALDE